MTRFKALSTFRFFIALGFGLAVLWALPASAPAAFTDGLLVFASDRPDGLNAAFDIYTMEGDGSSVTQITDHGGSEPAWSADGTKIAFNTQHDYGDPRAWPENVFFMNPDGSGKTYVIGADPSALSSSCGSNRHPSWSPDGTKLALHMTACYVNGQVVHGGIFVVDVATGDVTRLTSNRDGFGADIQPAWSHDGTKIAFAHALGSGYQITVMDPNGANVTVLTDGSSNSDPAWSPDDSKIVFASNRDGNYEIWAMDADGSNPVQLTRTDRGLNNLPDWSPDGSKIAFSSTYDTGGIGGIGDYEIWVMNADGGSPSQLTVNERDDVRPGWRPAESDPPPPHSGTAIEVVLDVEPDVDTDIDFNMFTQGGGLLESFSLDDDADPALPASHIRPTTAGSYLVSQGGLLKGYELSTVCTDPDGGTTISAGGSATVDLDEGETVRCTFTNTRTTAIEVVLDVEPDVDTDIDFNMFTQGGGLLESFSLDDDADPALPASHIRPTTAGSYLVSQGGLLKGYELSTVCTDPDGGTTISAGGSATVDLDEGETVRCTFTNTRTTAIEVVLDVEPDVDTDIDFNMFTQGGGLLESFSLDDDQDAALPASHIRPTTAGSYLVSQGGLLKGYELSTVCTDPDGGTTISAGGSATVDLDEGETVRCTFTNTRTTAIEVVLDVEPDVDTDIDFNMFTQGGGLLESFSLDDDADPALPASHIRPTTAGSYLVSQGGLLKGYELSTVCTDPDGGTTISAGGSATVDLDEGETVRCTFTNTKQPATGTIVINLDALPDDPQQFLVGFGGGGGAGTIMFLDDDGDSSLNFPNSYEFVRPAGSYSAVQDGVPLGWELTGLSCSDPDGGSRTELATGVATIDLDAGETVTCTYTETKAIGTIVVSLDSMPDDPLDFFFTRVIPPSGLPSLFELDDDTDPALPSSRTFVDQVAGRHTIHLQDTPGWDLTGLTCSDPDGGSTTNLVTRIATIDLDAGETVSCTYTETAQRGRITIVKDAVPDAKRDFSFLGSGGVPDFDLDDDDTLKTPSPLPRQRTFPNLTPGTYSIRERPSEGGYYLTSIVCNDPDDGTLVELDNRRVRIDLDWGENITCTFTNAQSRLIVVNDSVPDATRDFSFLGSGAVPDFDLDDDDTFKNPSPLPRQQMFPALTPGTYSIRERPSGGGFYLTSIVCDDPDGGTTVSLGDRRADVDLDPGETITCTFTNGQSRLIVVNDTVPDATRDFSFLGTGAVPDFDLDDDDTLRNPSGLPRQRTFTGIDPGVYRVRERPTSPEWTLMGIVCDDPDGGTTVSLGDRRADVDLDPGETVTCTFTNAASGP